MEWQVLFDQATGCEVKRDRYYGFGDSGSLAGSFEGYATAGECLEAVTKEHPHADISLRADELGSASICILSGEQYVERLRAIAETGADDVEGNFGYFGTEQERYEQARAKLTEDLLGPQEIKALAVDYGLGEELAAQLMADGEQPLGQPSPAVTFNGEYRFVWPGDEDYRQFSARDAWLENQNVPNKLEVLFAVLTVDQQRRALELLGWQVVA